MNRTVALLLTGALIAGGSTLASAPAVASPSESAESAALETSSVFTKFVGATIQNHAGVPLVLTAITDHWGGKAIVDNEWRLQMPAEWGFGPKVGDELSWKWMQEVKFVDWIYTAEWLDLTYTNPECPEQSISIRVSDRDRGKDATRLLAANGLGVRFGPSKVRKPNSSHRDIMIVPEHQ